MKGLRTGFCQRRIVQRALLLLALVLTPFGSFQAQTAATNRVVQFDTIRGTLRRFDQSPHVAVPVQLLDRSNQVVQTQLSDGTGGYSFTNVPRDISRPLPRARRVSLSRARPRRTGRVYQRWT